MLPILTRATPNLPCTGWLTSPDGSEKAASAISLSIIPDFATMPRATSAGLSPRSLARSSNDVPDAMRLRAVAASSALGNTICDTSRFGGWEAGGEGRGDLPAPRSLSLVRDIKLPAEAELPDRGLETGRIEITVDALEIGVAENNAHGLGLGLSEPEPPRFLVKRGFGDRLLQHLAIEAEGAGLIRGQRAPELAADLLQLVGVELAELIDRGPV